MEHSSEYTRLDAAVGTLKLSSGVMVLSDALWQTCARSVTKAGRTGKTQAVSVSQARIWTVSPCRSQVRRFSLVKVDFGVRSDKLDPLFVTTQPQAKARQPVMSSHRALRHWSITTIVRLLVLSSTGSGDIVQASQAVCHNVGSVRSRRSR
jgi:hypothetical protein